jgi:hypothetical protein
MSVTTFTWTVTQLTCLPQAEGETDVVVSASIQCVAKNDVYSSVMPSIWQFTYTPGNPFTPYADLTQDQVLAWCYTAGCNQAETEAGLEAQIQYQINPPVVTPPLPWPLPPGPGPSEDA